MKWLILLACLIPTLVFGEVFSIIHYTDTHDTNAQKITAYNTWVLANDAPEERNIKFVIHSGDIIFNDGNATEANAGAAGMKALENIVPYLVIPGNHDYDFPPFQYVVTRESTNFDAAYPVSDFNLKGYWGGSYNSSMRNSYGTFTVDTQEYLVMGLEYCPEAAAVIPWAATALDAEVLANPNIKIILFTHQYFRDASQMIATVPTFGCVPGLEAMNGQDLYENFISNYPNIILVLSGHNWDADLNGSAKFQSLVGDGYITQSRINFQQLHSSIDDVLRIWTIDTASTTIQAETWSIDESKYLTDSSNAFTIKTDVLPKRVTTGVVTEGAAITNSNLN